ncbi:MAG: ABC transporter permease [Deltaproteobacteria bacterium]|nr:ABC transporter permease [Deltaproteobacteria bacterium]
MFFQLAWRNIWRNPKRTLILLTAIVIGVWSMIFLGALMRGISDQMVRNGIANLTGHVQIHLRGYRNDPVVENSILQPGKLEEVLAGALPKEAHWTERVRVYAVASNARHSIGVTLVGIDSAREAQVSFIGSAVTQGDYLQPGKGNGILIGQSLAEKFKTELGKKLVLMALDSKGDNASRAFRISGIFRAELEAIEKQFVFVNLDTARQMLKLKGGISEISILLPEKSATEAVVQSLRKQLPVGDSLEVASWLDLLPFVTAVMELYDGFIFIWFLIIFIAMGFGIVNTILMAVFERVREFGLLKALGMKPVWIVRQVLTESFLLLLVGQVLGCIFGLVSVALLARNGIDLSAFAEGLEYAGMSRMIFPVVLVKDVVMANLVVFILGVLVSLYPAVKAARFTPVEALART